MSDNPGSKVFAAMRECSDAIRWSCEQTAARVAASFAAINRSVEAEQERKRAERERNR